MEINIDYFSKGGQFPYQAEGIINNKDYFYYRARGDVVSLELYENEQNLKSMSGPTKYERLEKNSFVTEEEVENDIKQLYKLIYGNI